jgi:D-3-phosphoglycerate dehydrogenase
MGLLLSMLNNIPLADDQVRRLKWLRDENRGTEINGKTIGIIGYGNMGSALAARLVGFGARVIAYDKYKKGFGSAMVKPCPLKELQEQSDIISLHVPLTDETRYMFNAAFIKKCKKPFWLVNTSRGKVVDTEALVSALRSGKVRGAALDVLEYEDISFEKMNLRGIPAPLEYLLSADNVVLTPHVAGWTVESKFKLADVLADKILGEFAI